MGFRNPFRLQVDENDVAYVSDYSPDANTPPRSRGPSGVGPLRDRPQAGQLRLSDLLLEQARLLPVELPRVRAGHDDRRHAAGQPAAADRLRRRRAHQRLALEPRRRPGQRARPARAPAGHRSGHLVLLPRQQRGDPARHAVLRLLRDDPGADRAGLDDRVPAAVPGAVHRRRRPARHREVPLRPGQPEHEEVPALLRRLGDPGRVHAGHAARGQARLAEPRVQDQQRSWTAARRTRRTRRSRSSATTRWTCSWAPTARSTC